MNINFKTRFPWNDAAGEPERTFFPDRILLALGQHPEPESTKSVIGQPFAKHHTIRRIPANGKPRYREGMDMVFATGSRFKPEVFARGKCTRVEYMRMELNRYSAGTSIGIWLQEPGVLYPMMTLPRMQQLAENDGLTMDQFTKWFTLDLITNGPGHFQIVHWSDIRYCR